MTNISERAGHEAPKNESRSIGSERAPSPASKSSPPREGGSGPEGIARAAARLISRAVNQIEQRGLPLVDWPSPRVTTWINVAQVAVWTAIAMAVLPGRGHFTYDQAYFYELSVRVAETLRPPRSEEHTSELQSPCNIVCRLLLEKKKYKPYPLLLTKKKKKKNKN